MFLFYFFNDTITFAYLNTNKSIFIFLLVYPYGFTKVAHRLVIVEVDRLDAVLVLRYVPNDGHDGLSLRVIMDVHVDHLALVVNLDEVAYLELTNTMQKGKVATKHMLLLYFHIIYI